MRFKEPPIDDKKGHHGEKYITQIVDSGKYIVSHGKVKSIILYSIVFYIFYRGGFFMFQPYFKGAGIPVEYYGIIFFLFNIIAGVSSKNCYRIMEKTKGKTLMFLSSLMIVSFLLLGVIPLWFGFAAILLQQIARGLYGPATRKYLNKNIPSDKRATILSFSSLLTNLAAAAAYPLFGVLKDSVDIFSTHMVLAVVMLVLTLLTSIYMRGKLGVKRSDKQ
jgi:predicted MFS family arabinose efflux permease